MGNCSPAEPQAMSIADHRDRSMIHADLRSSPIDGIAALQPCVVKAVHDNGGRNVCIQPSFSSNVPWMTSVSLRVSTGHPAVARLIRFTPSKAGRPRRCAKASSEPSMSAARALRASSLSLTATASARAVARIASKMSGPPLRTAESKTEPDALSRLRRHDTRHGRSDVPAMAVAQRWRESDREAAIAAVDGRTDGGARTGAGRRLYRGILGQHGRVRTARPGQHCRGERPDEGAVAVDVPGDEIHPDRETALTRRRRAGRRSSRRAR